MFAFLHRDTEDIARQSTSDAPIQPTVISQNEAISMLTSRCEEEPYKLVPMDSFLCNGRYGSIHGDVLPHHQSWHMRGLIGTKKNDIATSALNLEGRNIVSFQSDHTFAFGHSSIPFPCRVTEEYTVEPSNTTESPESAGNAAISKIWVVEGGIYTATGQADLTAPEDTRKYWNGKLVGGNVTEVDMGARFAGDVLGPGAEGYNWTEADINFFPSKAGSVVPPPSILPSESTTAPSPAPSWTASCVCS